MIGQRPMAAAVLITGAYRRCCPNPVDTGTDQVSVAASRKRSVVPISAPAPRKLMTTTTTGALSLRMPHTAAIVNIRMAA